MYFFFPSAVSDVCCPFFVDSFAAAPVLLVTHLSSHAIRRENSREEKSWECANQLNRKKKKSTNPKRHHHLGFQRRNQRCSFGRKKKTQVHLVDFRQDTQMNTTLPNQTITWFSAKNNWHDRPTFWLRLDNAF